MPADMRSVVLEHVRAWAATDVAIGCSGAFTVERSLAGLDLRLHGNDVGLFSCALGAFLAGDGFRCEVKPEWKADLAWMLDYLGTPEDLTATVLLCSAAPGPLTKIGTTGHYYARMRDGYRRQWPELHAKTKDKLLAAVVAGLKLDTFHRGDVTEFVHASSHPLIVHPPSSSDQAQHKELAEVFDWDAPEFEPWSEDGEQQLVDALVARDQWLYVTDRRIPDLEPHLHSQMQSTSRTRQSFIYAAGGPVRTVRPNTQIEPVMVPRLRPDAEPADYGRLALVPITPRQLSGLRAQYLNHNIAPGEAMMAIGVTVDGALAGAFAMSPGKFSGDDVYLMTDFPVAPGRRRLAKLIICAALSTEARALMERVTSKPARNLTTTAFSQHKASMKYRGLLTLAKRVDSEDPNFRFQLTYNGDMGRWDLPGALAEWKTSYASDE